MSFRDFVMNNHKLLHENKVKFYQIFSITLSKYLNQITGFDLVEFDRRIKVPDGISTKDFIETKYGKVGVTIIENLIGGQNEQKTTR